MIVGELAGDAALIKYLDGISPRLRAELRKRMTMLAVKLQSSVKRDKLSGQVLKRRTGTLSRSIARDVSAGPEGVEGRVGTNLSYAPIHEFGGKTRPHIIEAKKAQALRFTSGGKTVFARRVNHPGSQMPERSFLRSALADLRAEIEDTLQDAFDA